ncbi:trypsin-like serine peptidase [Dermatophilus congolensis]|uniref:V8-like Glu-specific endopeptidase n=1 Tax=Dermatophilus congolensis TaxID=1863 RepID=A0AA46H1C3_9MICO|nr:hypothetical protein [Dermatophilus congolensis]MBO3143802.1 hypothetical protein [Dermatophilus congolensis]MBO3152793.1 hypothetical protein [Dermatophilus congolensis]MBO3160196.1 hypothetical protein [Dermatophilus congolensis]MBO3164078.1 hypothetical protein [Dermatophilus congolensis]MBO3177623.1 hypothetical protein [Dermatophilus congolensis]
MKSFTTRAARRPLIAAAIALTTLATPALAYTASANPGGQNQPSATAPAGPGASTPTGHQDPNKPFITHEFTQQKKAVTDYWTPERMKAAIDMTQDFNSDQNGPTAAPTAKPTEPAKQQSAQPMSYAGTTVPRAAAEAPRPTIGKVFFKMRGKDYVCSANSVQSKNKSVVATAGHCANDKGQYADSFMFVPAYENGKAPLGEWVGVRAYTPTDWVQRGEMNMDTAFVVIAPAEDGSKLADKVGATGVAFNQPRGQEYSAFGYPAAKPFDGQTLKSCHGKAQDDRHNSKRTSQGIPCDMTGGSSGGPWFVGNGYDPAKSVQNSVNSYGYKNTGTDMYGPYWGKEIQQAYEDASADNNTNKK